MPLQTEGEISLGDIGTELQRTATEIKFDDADVRELVGSVGGPTIPGTEIQMTDFYGAAAGGALPDKVGVTDGVDGNYFSSPDSAAISVTGNLSLVWYGSVAVPPPGTNALVSKYDIVSSERSYSLQMSTIGSIQFALSNDGIANDVSELILSPVLSPNQQFGVRVDYTAGSGAVEWYVDYGSGWVSEFSDTHTIKSIFDSSADLEVSSRTAGSDVNNGIAELAQVWDGAYGTGTLVAEFQPDQAPGYGIGQTWASDNTGEQWTGQGNASIDAVNVLVLDTFTDANGVFVENHTPDINVSGGGWSVDTPSELVIQSNAVTTVTQAGFPGMFIETGQADVLLEGTFVPDGTGADDNTTTNSLWGRMPSIGSGDWVIGDCFIRSSDGQWALRLRVNGADIGQAVIPNMQTGVPYDLSLSLIGDVYTFSSSYGQSVSYTDPAPGSGTLAGSYFFDRNFLSELEEFKVTSITDFPIGTAPTVEAGGPYQGDELTAIALDATVTPTNDPNPVLLWTEVSALGGTFSDAAIADPTFTPDVSGDYVLRLSVTPSDVPAVTDDATLTSFDAAVPVPPTVDAGGPYTGTELTAIALDATVTPGSGNPVYTWTEVTALGGTFLPDVNTIDATFTPDVDGAYTLRLTAVPDDGPDVSDDATLTSEEIVPLADKVAVLTGAGGTDSFSTPNQAFVYNGGFSIEALVQLDFYISGANQQLFTHYLANTGQRSVQFRVSPTGFLELLVGYNNGDSARTATATAITPASPLQKIWLRASMGTTGNVQFWYSNAVDSEPPASAQWVKIGDTVTIGAEHYPPPNPGVPVQLFANGSGVNSTAGNLFRLLYNDAPSQSVRNQLLDFNPDQAPGYGTGQTWPSTNTGEQWTGQGNASINAALPPPDGFFSVLIGENVGILGFNLNPVYGAIDPAGITGVAVTKLISDGTSNVVLSMEKEGLDPAQFASIEIRDETNALILDLTSASASFNSADGGASSWNWSVGSAWTEGVIYGMTLVGWTQPPSPQPMFLTIGTSSNSQNFGYSTAEVFEAFGSLVPDELYPGGTDTVWRLTGHNINEQVTLNVPPGVPDDFFTKLNVPGWTPEVLLQADASIRMISDWKRFVWDGTSTPTTGTTVVTWDDPLPGEMILVIGTSSNGINFGYQAATESDPYGQLIPDEAVPGGSEVISILKGNNTNEEIQIVAPDTLADDFFYSLRIPGVTPSPILLQTNASISSFGGEKTWEWANVFIPESGMVTITWEYLEPEAPAAYLSDTFTDADNTLLSDHTPDIDVVGGGWFASTGGVVNSAILSNRVQFALVGGGNNDSVLDIGVTDFAFSFGVSIPTSTGGFTTQTLNFRRTVGSTYSGAVRFIFEMNVPGGGGNIITASDMTSFPPGPVEMATYTLLEAEHDTLIPVSGTFEGTAWEITINGNTTSGTLNSAGLGTNVALQSSVYAAATDRAPFIDNLIIQEIEP